MDGWLGFNGIPDNASKYEPPKQRPTQRGRDHHSPKFFTHGLQILT